MSAFSSQSSGSGGFLLGGIVIIAIVAVGFSGLSSNLFESTSIAELNEERAGRIHDQGVKLASSQRELVRQKKILIEQTELVRPVKEAKELTTELEILKDEVADLQLEATKREGEIAELKELKARYRSGVRSRLWPRYLKQELKQEHLLGPMRYQNPRISKIDAAGLLVAHDSGVVRIEVAELSKKFRELLDLDVSEAKQVMMEMLLKDARAKKSRVQKADQLKQPSAAEIDDIMNRKLSQGIDLVYKYVDLIDYADDAAKVARYNDRYSSNRSVPGKLETWAERANKFEKAGTTYRKKLMEAAAEVKKFDPNFNVPWR